MVNTNAYITHTHKHNRFHCSGAHTFIQHRLGEAAMKIQTYKPTYIFMQMCVCALLLFVL